MTLEQATTELRERLSRTLQESSGIPQPEGSADA